MIVDPFGDIMTKCGDDPAIIYAEIDFEHQENLRQQMNFRAKRRTDLYETKSL